ncbi:MAG: peptidoglycan-binding protein, partial [Saprospiraceae bacterium]|nr:peptidoglycan-binding protein [Saprospiraceae bacterium]
IQKGLKDNGYDLPENGLMDEATTLAIEDFQRSQHIAYGEITLETLTLLGVN